jgi:hypothetical protein
MSVIKTLATPEGGTSKTLVVKRGLSVLPETVPRTANEPLPPKPQPDKAHVKATKHNTNMT